MKEGRLYIIYVWLAISTLPITSCSEKKETMFTIQWNNRLSLPPCQDMPVNKGLAGAFAGIVDNELILLGGANFPEASPWEGGTKAWWPALYNIGVGEDASAGWTVQENFLEKGLAYGVSIQLPGELLCIGGCDQDRCYARVFSIVKGMNGKLVLGEIQYPDLPVPLANAAGTVAGNKIYLAGGQETMKGEASTRHFFCLDLECPESGWATLPPWPGPSRAYAVCESQEGKVYLFSGRSFGPGEETIRHEDGYAYDPSTETWEKLPGRYPVMAGTAIHFASDKILLLGGVAEILPSTPDHPGFSNAVQAFDINDYSLTKVADSPWPIPVTSRAIPVGRTFYIASGEIRPGVRTPYILQGTIE